MHDVDCEKETKFCGVPDQDTSLQVLTVAFDLMPVRPRSGPRLFRGADNDNDVCGDDQ